MAENVSKGAQCAKYTPDLFERSELSEFPWIFRSRDRKVYLVAAGKASEGTYLKGFVESDSRPGMYHYVVAMVGSHHELVGGGFCECESRVYYGKPCKHILKIRNIMVKNRSGIPGLDLARKEG
jgi:hypothetical protein